MHGDQYIITKLLTELKGVNQMDKCAGCIMTKHKCLIIDVAQEYINRCPCLKCLVKITCDYDTICDRYNSYMKLLAEDEKYTERIREYERIYNATL